MFPQRSARLTDAKPYLLGAAAGIALGLLAWWLCTRVFVPVPDPSTYQAVFLTNNQVYFGRLTGIWSRAPVLDDVYYLQVNQPLQQGAAANRAATGTPSATPQFSLNKLGQSEIHGPQDRLFLMKQQVLFWENLRSDSQVVKTIQEFKKQNPR